jgi:hypothetical protein
MLIDRVSQPRSLVGCPVDRLIREFNADRFGMPLPGRLTDRAAEIAPHGARYCDNRFDLDRVGDGQPCGKMLFYPSEQRCNVRGKTGRDRKERGIGGRQLVDDRQARLDRRAMLGID